MKILYLFLILVLNILARKRNKICNDADCFKYCHFKTVHDIKGKVVNCNKGSCFPGQKPLCYCSYKDPELATPIICPNAYLPVSYPNGNGVELSTEEILKKQAEQKKIDDHINEVYSGHKTINKKKHHK